MAETTQVESGPGGSHLDVDFSPTPAQEDLLERVRRAGEGLEPDVREPGHLAACLERLRGAGLLGITLAADAGGLGGGWQELGLALAALAGRTDGLALAVHAAHLAPYVAGREDLLAAAAAGEGLTALAHREAGMATDAAILGATATASGEGYEIDGEKYPVIYLPGTGRLVVSARLENEVGRFLVDVGAPGVRVEPVAMRGLLACPLAKVSLEAVSVGTDALLGRAGSSAELSERASALWHGVKAGYEIRGAAAAVDLVVEDSKTKMTFGKPLLRWQAIQFRLVDVQARLDLLEPLAWYFTWLLDNPDEKPPGGLSRGAYGELLRLQTARYVGGALETAVEVGGGRMFNEEHPLWRRYMTYLAGTGLDGSEAEAIDRIAGEL